MLAILLFETAIQLPRFRDDATIYATSLEVAPRNLLAHTYFARALWLYGRHEEGLREFKISTELAPRSWGTYESYATALAEVGRNEEAIVEYNKALQWTPGPTRFRAFLLYELAAVELKCSEYSGSHEPFDRSRANRPGISELSLLARRGADARRPHQRSG